MRRSILRRPSFVEAALAPLLLASLGLASSASAQTRAPRDDFDRAEDSGRLDDDAHYRTGDLHLPGTRDPLDHSAYLEVGWHRARDSAAGTTNTAVYLPMRLGVDVPVANHVQLRVRMPLAGYVERTVTAGREDAYRMFRPGNLEAGAYYAVGGGERSDDFRWSLFAGGTAVLPTGQLPDNPSAGTALRTTAAFVGGWAVNGLQGGWGFAPEHWGFVPGATGRVVFGPVFVNASLNVALTFPTDDAQEALHMAEVRAELGYAVADTFRAGLGITDVALFGPGASGVSDSNQFALRLFARAELVAFTLGAELVINRGAPFGDAFDGASIGSGVWGLVGTAGLSF